MSDSELELWTLDELCDHAFAIFEELAEENLSAEDYALYQQHAATAAYVDLVPASEDWVDIIAMDIDPELHVEAHIGLAEVNHVAEIVLARILLSKEKFETLCHARWRGQE
ncbi:DUF440 family protein [Rheinheimera mesophila]|uniref:DUF440 family protein n=1 Tax=Rheinheimera mesophila TaxID=1547515 RepID=A0A3P3QE52_9GAMM|nr:DUF440 family protein [Rheinheimera mesophila]KKL03175.1 dsDNA-mimic protein [Rheinheimera mesophila]RRJ19476.1 DUF440 family protein [Rheinheimera mesophila]